MRTEIVEHVASGWQQGRRPGQFSHHVNTIVRDSKIPNIDLALDDDEMLRIFSGCPELFGKEITAIKHQLLKHTVGKRCVISYWILARNGEFGGQRVIGKIYRKNRGKKNFDNLRNLYRASQASQIPIGMSEPIAYLPELGMILQSVVPGRSLSSFVGRDDFSRVVQATARNLAMLHGLNVLALEQKTMSHHVEKYCRPGTDVLLAVYPRLVPLVEPLIERLIANASIRRTLTCPVHGDLGFDQILVSDYGAAFVDFDGICESAPALDIGNFLVTLKVYLGSEGQGISELFLKAYLQSQHERMLAGLDRYQALAYLRRAMICFRQNRHDRGALRKIKKLLKASSDYSQRN